MATIELTRGRSTSISEIDVDLAMFNWSWQASAGIAGHPGYGKRSLRKSEGVGIVYLHRVIAVRMGILLSSRLAEDPRQVDHQDGGGTELLLNNQRDNLRVANYGQNASNRRKRTDAVSSRFKGVTFHRNSGKWHAEIKQNGKRISLGYYRSEEDAAWTYNQRAKELFGEFAHLNEV